MLQKAKSISMANQQTTRMRGLVVLLGMALIFSPCLRAQEATWRIDPLHSGAHFRTTVGNLFSSFAIYGH